MNTLPTIDDIQALHRKYAPGEAAFKSVWYHSVIVRDVAMQLIEHGNLTVDADLVEAGCLLHDIGVYPLLEADGTLRKDATYITHGTEGERILRQEGFAEQLWRFASHHTGVGLTKADITAQKLPLPMGDYLAETDEELLVMYADKFHSKTTPPHFNSYEWYEQHVRRFGDEKAATLRQMSQKFGIPDLTPLSQKYGHDTR